MTEPIAVAIRMADYLDTEEVGMEDISAELRRLHAENKGLRERLRPFVMNSRFNDPKPYALDKRSEEMRRQLDLVKDESLSSKLRRLAASLQSKIK
jgi:hypothetical protein